MKISTYKQLTVLALCVLASLSGHSQFISDTIEFNGYERFYDVYLPPAYQPGNSLPVVIDLHYLGGDARDEDTLTQFNPIADTADFIVCHPWGQGTNWNAGFASPYWTGPGDTLFISQMIDSLVSKYSVNQRRVYVVGMGQGGFMANRIGCELDRKVAAVASVGGAMADSAQFYCNSNRPVSVMLINGTADSVINYYSGSPGFWQPIDSLVQFWVQRNGCTPIPSSGSLPDLVNEGSTIETETWTCPDSTELLLYRVVNGGFAWPGATDSLPNSGIINQDINAASEVWNFFKRFELPAELVGVTNPEELNQRINIWPNPVSDQLNIELEKGSIDEVIILDMMGRVAKSYGEFKSRQITLKVSELDSGIYFVILNSRKGSVSRKFIKE